MAQSIALYAREQKVRQINSYQFILELLFFRRRCQMKFLKNVQKMN